MTTEGNFSAGTIIYVSTQQKLNSLERQNITSELLRIIGSTNGQSVFKFRFAEEDKLIQAHASADGDLKISIRN